VCLYLIQLFSKLVIADVICSHDVQSAGEDVDSHSAGQLPGHHLEMTEYEALKVS